MASITLEVVTPERTVFRETVDHVVLPTVSSGEIDVLPGHIPLMTIIEPGALRFFKDGKPDSIAIDKGFIRVYADTVSVLTEAAIEVEKIDTSQADEARRRAEEALAKATEEGADPAILEELETKARFAVLQKIIADTKRL
ncbi:MAG: ATP synthase F1 subunit epsilon [Opitutales bacterium]|nr:ATP synthase F1 subunit epsilon [Opitutales bacterium]